MDSVLIYKNGGFPVHNIDQNKNSLYAVNFTDKVPLFLPRIAHGEATLQLDMLILIFIWEIVYVLKNAFY